jgi:hypothetical protein
LKGVLALTCAITATVQYPLGLSLIIKRRGSAGAVVDGMESVLNALVTAAPRMQIVYQDWPTFGFASRETARAAVVSQWQGKHAAFHEALLTSPARLDSSEVEAAAAKAKATGHVCNANCSRAAERSMRCLRGPMPSLK